MSHSSVQREQEGEQGYTNPPDVTPRREGGEDAVAERIIADDSADEKVLDKSDTAPPAARPLKMDETHSSGLKPPHNHL